jgi:hypothetical protein
MTPTDNIFILAAAISVVSLLLVAVGFVSNVRDWNGGVCPTCGRLWSYVRKDKDAGRGYECANGHTIWIAWPVDRKRNY